MGVAAQPAVTPPLQRTRSSLTLGTRPLNGKVVSQTWRVPVTNDEGSEGDAQSGKEAGIERAILLVGMTSGFLGILGLLCVARLARGPSTWAIVGLALGLGGAIISWSVCFPRRHSRLFVPMLIGVAVAFGAIPFAVSGGFLALYHLIGPGPG
jgi:hypothetical protein